MTLHTEDFPFEEIRKESGDYFDSAQEAMDATGLGLDHIWSVVCEDDTYCYGPSHHYVNLIGFVATKEAHDGETYYEETLDFEEEDYEL